MTMELQWRSCVPHTRKRDTRCQIHKCRIVFVLIAILCVWLVLVYMNMLDNNWKVKYSNVSTMKYFRPLSRSGNVSRSMATQGPKWTLFHLEKFQKWIKYFTTGAVPAAPNKTVDLLKRILQHNGQRPLLNVDRFPGTRPIYSVIIVVQVHSRVQHLGLLIESLRQVRGIQEALLVFSHDLVMEEMDHLVRQVDFCRAMQIYFPFSRQIFPEEFPGHDPEDCERDSSRSTALRLQCNNAAYADRYGHYREAKYTQTKHHWWWKLIFVYRYVLGSDWSHSIVSNTTPVLLLEEDHYLFPDALHVLHAMASLNKSQRLNCDILCLGTYDLVQDFAGRSAETETASWHATQHNMAMVLTPVVLSRMLSCADAFCSHDDYNWDWSLQVISESCLKGHFKVMMARAPRAHHTGSCGMHHRGGACSPEPQRARLTNLLKSVSHSLFPAEMRVTLQSQKIGGKVASIINGGWADVRDVELCRSYKRHV
uniref:alpha-1,6-mannosyl-glycoprotein 2-beta-N-acetylglucosaminyltransferase n=1 Tax=Myxine glutinosa TaxID=7769 RepID=UPI0035901BF9